MLLTRSLEIYIEVCCCMKGRPDTVTLRQSTQDPTLGRRNFSRRSYLSKSIVERLQVLLSASHSRKVVNLASLDITINDTFEDSAIDVSSIRSHHNQAVCVEIQLRGFQGLLFRCFLFLSSSADSILKKTGKCFTKVRVSVCTCVCTYILIISSGILDQGSSKISEEFQNYKWKFVPLELNSDPTVYIYPFH